MRTRTMVVVLIVLGTGAAGAAPLRFGDIEIEGLAWETGGAASVVGDTLEMLGIVTQIDTLFWGVDLNTHELTVRFTDLVVEVVSPHTSWWFVGYSQGHAELWLDASRDHDYGTDPPNAKAPTTFTNGTLFLGGTVQSFGIVYYPGNPFGYLSGNVVFTEGAAIDLAHQWTGWGWPVLSGTVHPTGFSEPQGYDLRTLAYLYPVVDAVRENTWGAVKALYRVR